MRKYNQYDFVVLKDGRIAAIVDFIGEYYIVDVGSSPVNWDAVEVLEEDIVGRKDEFYGMLSENWKRRYSGKNRRIRCHLR